jgi:hypothetical protein
VDDTKVIPNVLQSRVELSQLQYPPPSAEPIPRLAPPKLDVLECRHCSYKIRQVQAMQEHQGGDQHNVNQEVVNQVDVNQLNPTQRSLFLLINQLNIIAILSWLRWQG